MHHWPPTLTIRPELRKPVPAMVSELDRSQPSVALPDCDAQPDTDVRTMAGSGTSNGAGALLLAVGWKERLRGDAGEGKVSACVTTNVRRPLLASLPLPRVCVLLSCHSAVLSFSTVHCWPVSCQYEKPTLMSAWLHMQLQAAVGAARKPEPVMRTTSLSTRQPPLGQPDTDVRVKADTPAKMTKGTAALVSSPGLLGAVTWTRVGVL
jgi:hypothetical protein